MNASPVLVDSSWYITRMRQGQHPLRELLPIAMTRDIATCGIVRAEVARGLRDVALLTKFQQRWEVMLDVPTDDALWSAVEETIWKLDRAGVCLPLPDVVIACCARRIGAVILTCDEHFHRIPGVRATNRIL